MKKARIEKISLATIAIAVSIALCSNAYANAETVKANDLDNSNTKNYPSKQNSDDSYSVKTTRLSKPITEHGQVTQNFATKTAEQMTLKTSEAFLKNLGFADSSTFPKRLLNTLAKNPWRAAPSSPIKYRDLACFYGVPSYRPPVKTTEDSPVNVTADSVSGEMLQKNKQVLTYTGNVVVTQGDKEIVSDKVIYSGANRTLTTDGSSVLSSGEYTVHTDSPAQYDLDKKTISLQQSKYQMNGSVMNGEAKEHVNDGVEKTKLFKKATLSGCPIDRRSWHLYSSSISMKEGDSFGEAWNDVFFMGPVPVFYTPYANFPITNERKSGLLPAMVEYKSGSGLSYELPIYLNLAPNYDATVTPGHDSKHGNIYDLEFRYLPFKNFSGSINGTYLPNDSSFSRVIENSDGTSETDSTDHKRWFINLKNNLNFLQNDLNFILDYSKVRKGDYTYLSDISQKNAAITDSSLMQSLKATYVQDHYDLSAEARKYQSMYSTASYYTYRPFALLPQLKASVYDTAGSFRFRTKAEFTRFSIDKYTSDNKNVNMDRYHLEPSVHFNAYDSYGTTVDFGATGYLTHYQQNDLKYFSSSYKTRLGYSDYEESVNRALYLLEARAKTTLERKVLDMNHTQTLEPEIKYMYIPYKNQDNIALYDTTDRYSDYYTLFSPHYYAGIDRIANLNTITAGFTSRLLDAHDKEKVRFSIAQAVNLENNKVKLYQYSVLREKHSSPIQATIDAIPFNNGFSVHAAAQYETQDSRFTAYNTALRYTDSASGFMAGVSYRFFKDGNYLVTAPTTAEDLSQLGLEAKLPISANWTLFGASYRDLKQSYNIDTKLGLRYEDCCYAVSLLYENYLKYNYKNKIHESDKIIGLNIEFKGFYEINLRGINDPHGTSTHYLPSLMPTDLNR